MFFELPLAFPTSPQGGSPLGSVMCRVSCSNYSYTNYSNILWYSNPEYFWTNIRTIRIPKKRKFDEIWSKKNNRFCKILRFLNAIFREIDWIIIKICQNVGFLIRIFINILLCITCYALPTYMTSIIRQIYWCKFSYKDECGYKYNS